MPIQHTVTQGEGLARIAYRYGFFWQTLWGLQENAALRELRGHPEFLLPGDKIHIPDKRQKTLDCATGRSHRFQVKGVPSKLNLRLTADGKPRADEAYTLEVDGKPQEGRTDADGWVRCVIPPDASKGRLSLRNGTEVYTFRLGYIDPIDTLSGMQARLRNLGFYRGPVDGKERPEFLQALGAFQASKGLPQRGMADQATLDALKGSHQDEGS